MSGIHWRAAEVEDLEVLGGRGLDVPSLHYHDTVSFTLDGEVVAVWGLMMRWPQVADLWGVVDNVKVRGRHAYTFTRLSRRLLRVTAYGLRLRRVTAFVEAERPEYRRFAEGAEFHPEAVLEGAGPNGGDLIIYVRKFPWAALSAASSAEVETSPPPRPHRPHLRLITSPSGATTGSGPERPEAATRPT